MSGRRDGPREVRTPPGEWAVGILGTVLVLGTIGFMVNEALTGASSPPDLSVELASVTPVSEGWLALVEVRNDGGRTAAEVLVEGELQRPGAPVERSEVTLDFVPGRARRTAGLQFEHDPRTGTLTLRPKGFDEP